MEEILGMVSSVCCFFDKLLPERLEKIHVHDIHIAVCI